LIESLFAGGGDMGARMRAVDWSTTVLGPLEQWPQSLRACVRIVPKLIHYNRVEKGGHFAAWERPQLFSEEVRAGFRSLRQ
jgi:hypothetical protein